MRSLGRYTVPLSRFAMVPLLLLSAMGRMVAAGVPTDGVAVLTSLGFAVGDCVYATRVGVMVVAAVEVLAAAGVLLRRTGLLGLGLIRWWIAVISLGAVFIPELVLFGPGGHLTERAPMAASIASLAAVLLLAILASREVGLVATEGHQSGRASLLMLASIAFFCGGCAERAERGAPVSLVTLRVETADGSLVAVEGFRGEGVPALNGRPAGFIVLIPSTTVRCDGHVESLRALCPGVPVFDTEQRLLGSVVHWAEGSANHVVLVLPHAEAANRLRLLALSATEPSDLKPPGVADVETEIGHGVKVCTVWGDAVFGVEATIALKDGRRVLLASDAGSAPLSAIYGSGPCEYAVLRAPPLALVRSLPDTRIIRRDGPLVGTAVAGGGTWLLGDLGVAPRCLKVTMTVERGARQQEWRFAVALRPGSWFGVWLKQAIGHLLASSNLYGRSADLKLRLDGSEWSERRVEAEGRSLARAVAESVLNGIGSSTDVLEGRTLSVEVSRR